MHWEKPAYGQMYGVYMFLSILVVPLSIMVFAYASICHRVWVLDEYRPTVVKQRYGNMRVVKWAKRRFLRP